MTGKSLSTARDGKSSKNKLYTYNSNMKKKDLGKYTKDQMLMEAQKPTQNKKTYKTEKVKQDKRK